MEQNDVFERLKSAVIKAQNELDLPDHIADSVMEIASRPTFFASKAKNSWATLLRWCWIITPMRKLAVRGWVHLPAIFSTLSATSNQA
ncbi:MAG: hypothetical protein LRY50_09125 [Geovibrio sp.]|nr:hypothetical protein [Geovibrio sp.]